MHRVLPYAAGILLLGAVVAVWGIWNAYSKSRLPRRAPPAVRHRRQNAASELRNAVLGDGGSGTRAQAWSYQHAP